MKSEKKGNLSKIYVTRDVVSTHCLDNTAGPQKNTPTSVSGCASAILGNTLSQFGLPKWVGALRLVIASFSAPTSCMMMLFISSSLSLAVR